MGTCVRARQADGLGGTRPDRRRSDCERSQPSTADSAIDGPRLGAGAGARSRANDRPDLWALPASYAYLLGMYLGDGCLSKARRGVYRLRISVDLRYPAIIDECEAAIRELLPRSTGPGASTRARSPSPSGSDG